MPAALSMPLTGFLGPGFPGPGLLGTGLGLGLLLGGAGWAALEAFRRLRKARREVADLQAQLRSGEEQRRRLEQVLEEGVSVDPLTHAWNRRHFGDIIPGERHRSERYGHPLSLLLLDIDHFKHVNDAHGHALGDRVLQDVADDIRSEIRLADVLVRWNGGAFLVLMPNTGLPVARLLAERIRQAIETHLFARVGRVTASLGLAEYLPGGSLESWLERASQALCRAKHKGRNQVACDPQRHDGFSTAAHVENAFLKLVWNPVYASGNALIDAQHERMFQLSNELLEGLLSGRPADELRALAADLLSDVAQHFHDEETLLRRLGYPGLPEHANHHAELLSRGQDLLRAFENGTLDLGALLQFLAQEVVAQHMLKADRGYFHLISTEGAASAS